MADTLGTKLTMTTYGTWLRGDVRCWIDSGRLMPPDPVLERADRQRMKHSMYLFDQERLPEVGQVIGRSLMERMPVRIHAMTVRSWHVHVVVAHTPIALRKIVKCVKDAARWHLRVGRPIWGAGHDKRFCFNERSLRARIEYVERHNVATDWSPRP